MDEEETDLEKVCSGCGEEARMEFVKREDEYLVYECSLCGTESHFPKEEIEEEFEEGWKEWEKEWEE